MTPEVRAEHDAAYAAVRLALRTGQLVRQPCERCGSQKSAAHHRWGYSDPLRVAWLCASHHAEEHGVVYRATVPPYIEPRHWTYSERSSARTLRQHAERINGLLEAIA